MAILVLQWLARFVVPVLFPGTASVAIIGGVVGGLAILVWWLFFSRAPWAERIGGVVLMVLAVLGAYRVVHPSISNGMMGMMLPIYAIPVLCLALVLWAALSRRASAGVRYASLAAAVLLACSLLTLIRTGGMTGDADADLHWRWTKSAEEKLLAQTRAEAIPPTPTPEPAAAQAEPQPAAAQTDKETPAASPTPAAAKPAASWPGFRGAGRDGVVRNTHLQTDWKASPPVEVWRQPVGPGWSSFAVRGERLYTQEQRGEDELVACYELTTGKLVWRHRSAARFWESNAGAGPRGTPTLHGGRVYALGATGLLNALDATTGALLWSRNAAADTGAKLPNWGFAGSPLVIGDQVVVATSGKLAAYDLATGKPRWMGPDGQSGYSSPQLAVIDGVRQILLLSATGAAGVSAADGAQLWKYEWKGDGIVQPAVIAGADLLLGSGSGLAEVGLRRVSVKHDPTAGWRVEDRWLSSGLKPYYNDFVVHKGHAYGFDGSILACVDLADGKRTWKGGRYGHGQLLLLPDQDLLLVLSEEGELALVKAASDQFTELARVRALEGKTWNHPVLVGDLLLARNGEQMAAFRLPVADR